MLEKALLPLLVQVLPLLPRSPVMLLCCALWWPYIYCSLSARWI